MTHLC